MAKAKSKKTLRKNPVAKHGVRVNRAAVHADRKKAQKRGLQKYKSTIGDQD